MALLFGFYTVQVQAVFHKDLQLTGLVFHESMAFPLGESLTLEPSHPCLILVNHTKNTLTISDPTATHEHIELVVKGPTSGIQRLTIELPSGLDAGKSISIADKLTFN